MVGVVLFANAYMVTIPSWLNEKAPGVDVQKAIWIPVAVSAVVSTVFAITGAWAYKLLDFPHGEQLIFSKPVGTSKMARKARRLEDSGTS